MFQERLTYRFECRLMPGPGSTCYQVLLFSRVVMRCLDFRCGESYSSVQNALMTQALQSRCCGIHRSFRRSFLSLYPCSVGLNFV